MEVIYFKVKRLEKNCKILFEKRRVNKDANIEHAVIGMISARSQCLFTFKNIGYIPQESQLTNEKNQLQNYLYHKLVNF